MNQQQTFENLATEFLLARVKSLRLQGFRLVQISATRLPESVEVTYSFSLEAKLVNVRLQLPVAELRLPSISSIFGCAVLYENEMHDLFNIQVDGMALDFRGNFYKTAVKFPFGTIKPPTAPATPTPTATK